VGRSISINNLSDERLMNLAGKGSKDAFSIIYERYYNKMLNFFFRMLNSNEEKSRDFAHDLFLKLIEKPQMFDQSKRLRPWLYTIASNMCKNEYRSQEVRKNSNTEIAYTTDILIDESQYDTIDKVELKKRLKFELNNLDEINRNIFILRFYEELNIKEISNIIDCPEGTVKSKIFYTLKKLSVKLEDYNPLKN